MKVFSLRAVANKYHLALSTFRYYEEIGLLRNVPRKDTRRFYTQSHITRLNAVTCFKQTGMRLDEIMAFFQYEDDGGDLDAVVSLLKHHEASLDAHIQILKQNQVHIRRKVRFYEDIKTALTNHEPAPKWKDYPLTNFTDEALKRTDCFERHNELLENKFPSFQVLS